MKRLMAVAALAIPMSALALPALAGTTDPLTSDPRRYAYSQTYEVAPKSSGTVSLYCADSDQAYTWTQSLLYSASVGKGTSVKTTTTPIKGYIHEGASAQYTNRSNTTQTFTLTLICEPD